jgi:ABC-type arginine transport system permease subunit
VRIEGGWIPSRHTEGAGGYSMQTLFGMRSPQMWTRYLNGFQDVVDARRKDAAKTSVIGTVVFALTTAVIYLIVSAVRRLKPIPI